MNKFYTLLAAGLLCATQASAQLLKDLSELTLGATIEEAGITNYDENTTYDSPRTGCVLLYNVGAKKVMSFGGQWGTQASVGESGARVWLDKKSLTIDGSDITAYIIRTIVTSTAQVGEGTAMTYMLDTANPSNTAAGMYLDRDPDNSLFTGAGQSFYSYWTFEAVGDKNSNNEAYNSYKIKAACKSATSEAPATDMYIYLDPNTQNNPNQVLTAGALPSGLDESYAQWRLLTPATINYLLDYTYADGETPSDATIYILDWNLSRHNRFANYWKWLPTGSSKPTDVENGGKNGMTSDYQTFMERGYLLCGYDANGNITSNGYGGSYGKYHCGSLVKPGKFYQVIEIPRTGWYRLDCQGFGNNAELFAFEGEPGSENESTTDISIKNNFTALKPKQESTPDYSTFEAAKAFAQGSYANHILMYVEVPEGQERAKLTIGIRTTNKFTEGSDVACFDDFQLRYMGGEKTETILDQEDEDDARIKALQANRLYNIHIHYDARVNNWNAITLPVSLTKEQLQTMFDNPTLSELHSYTIDGERIVHFRTVDVFAKQAKDIVMEAGKAYLINIPKEPYRETYTFQPYKPNADFSDLEPDGPRVEVPTPYYTIPGVFLSAADIANITKTKTDDSVTSDDNETFYFKGALWKQTITDPLYYALNAGNWYRFTKPMKTKGFRAWLTQTPDANGETKGFSVYIDGIEDNELTGIFAPRTPADEQADNRGIYDLNGRRMDARSTKQLPRGIYIVNGHKYIK